MGARSWLLRLSSNDWVVLVYLCGLNVAWALASPSEQLSRSGPLVLCLLLLYVGLVIIFGRSQKGGSFWRALSYRLGHFGTVQLSYFVFQLFLPAVSPGSLDQQLLDLDMALFGVEPAMVFDHWISGWTTEWFSFFYYSYFFLLASHILPIVFFGRDHQLLAEFALGMTLVSTIGHTCYMLVPGFGPYMDPSLFQHELPEGLWWTLVNQIVESGGAHKDIFPSLHTAIPSFILLFSFHNRGLYPYRLTWPVVALFTANIIVATMFLRWHYLVDVIAGLILASVAYVISLKVSAWELPYRAQNGLGRVWPAWKGRPLPRRDRAQETPAQNPS